MDTGYENLVIAIICKGTLFAEDFAKLNQNGLFDLFSDAYAQMKKEVENVDIVEILPQVFIVEQ